LPACHDGAGRIPAMLQGVLVASWGSGAPPTVLPAASFSPERWALAGCALPRPRATARRFPDGVDRSVHGVVPPFSDTPPTALGPPVVISPATTACPPSLTCTY